MIGWIIFGVYLAGFLVALRYLSGNIAWGEGDGSIPDSGDWVWGLFVGFFGAALWPVVLPIARAYYKQGERRMPSRFLYTPPEHRERLMKERIRELEQEAGIR